MNFSAFATLQLQARLWLQKRGLIASVGVLFLTLACLVCLGYFSYARTLTFPAQLSNLTKLEKLDAAVQTDSEYQNLAIFYDALGERRYAEQQLKTIFALASKNGLSLAKGQYKLSYDKNSHVYTYQIVLPVKASYQAIWQFALQTLDTIPFAALNEVSFKRDSVTDNMPEASLHLSLYLHDVAKKGGP
ncbi:hypothetical protein [Undibacterium sp. Ren11W]|uniref:hypothetical protein n=1 Tax=Undibacterium sp. Ren11W TaxID=3413045 RepID=UPI003BEF6686